MNDVGGKDVPPKRIGKWREQRAIELHAFTRVDLRLSVERQMIGVLADQHVRQESGSGHSALNGARWRWRLHDRIAAGAGQFGTHVPNHFEAHRLQLKHFTDVFTQGLERITAVGAVLVRRRDELRFARQMRWKFAARLALRVYGWSMVFGAERFSALCFGGFEFLHPKLQLLDLPRALFAARAELQSAQFENLEF